MKRKPLTHAARLLCALALSMSLAPAALAADPSEPTQPSPCYPTAVTRSEDGTEIRKMYDLGPEDDPGGIPRSDFEQDGYHYTLTDLLKQELPANESRQHTETVSVNSKSKDMGAVLALLPQTKEFITEDGLSGVLTLKLDTVKVEVAGYGSSTKTVTATRTVGTVREVVSAPLPAVVSVTDQANEPRYPNFAAMRAAKKKPIDFWDVSELGLQIAEPAVAVVDDEARPAREAGIIRTDAGEAGRELATWLVENKLV